MIRLPRFASGVLLLVVTSACGELPDAAPRRADPQSLRTPAAGAIVGFAAEYDSHAWLGIPFAEPPLGELRFDAPRVAPPWEGTREALASGTPCMQIASPLGGVNDVEPGTPTGSEDCLYLDVYAPRFAPDKLPNGANRLPVMVWIYGGGNTIGHAGLYHGGHLATSGPVIVVIIQYRLGPFGWFSHAALRGEDASPSARSGNFGLLDQIRALEWVRANIEAFGGDPARVTIFGESAGGWNAAALLLSPLASGLFHRAIVQSGKVETTDPARSEGWQDHPVAGDLASSSEVLARLVVADGSAPDRAAARDWIEARTGSEIAAYLRAKSSAEILAAFQEAGPEDARPPMFTDGTVLPRGDPIALFRSGAYNAVPVMLGTNRDENKLSVAFDPEYARLRFGLAPIPRDPERFQALAEHLSALWKAVGADVPAEALHASQPGRVFVYRFDFDEMLSIPWLRLNEILGAFHGFEIPFVFGHWDLGPQSRGLFTPFDRRARHELSRQMMSYWTEFAYAGDPGQGRHGDLPHWLPWDDSHPEAHRYVILDSESDGGVRMGSEPVTVAQVLAAVAGDPRLRTPHERCIVYRELAHWSWDRDFDRDEYARLCRDFPYERHPWREEPDSEAAAP